RSHLECYEELESLRHHATQLATILSKSRQKDIWVDDQFKASLRDLLGSCNHFAGDFAVIRTNNRWESIIANLEYVYNTGGKLIAILTVGKDEENSDGIDFIKTHKSKAAIDYSTKLQQSLNNLLEQWQRFCEQVDQLPDEYDTLLTLFNDFHYKYILENWQKLKLFALWRKQELAEPGNVMEFFDMLKHILDNHRQFLEETADGTKEIEPVTMKEKNIKVLDPFIDSRTRKNRSEKMAD
ncbi:MAG: hypothetical protein GY757_06265, partial [bacterium]|nr:hypothetical protein [bacterium]